MAFLLEVVVDGRVNRGELLQTSHLPEAQHGPFSSSWREMRILSPIIEPTACFLSTGIANDFHGGAVGPQFIGHGNLRVAVSLQ